MKKLKMLLKRGFSLIELAIALMICTVLITGLLALYKQSLYSAKKMYQRETAITIAENKMEDFRNYEFSKLSLGEEYDTLLDKYNNADSNGEFIRNTEVTPNYLGNSSLTLVSILVDFKMEGKYTEKPLVVTKLFAEQQVSFGPGDDDSSSGDDDSGSDDHDSGSGDHDSGSDDHDSGSGDHDDDSSS